MPIHVSSHGAAVAAAVLSNEPAKSQHPQRYDSQYDFDGSGTIDQDEIRSASSEENVSLTLQKVRDLIGDGHKLTTLLNHIDKDGDGVVTKEELMQASQNLIKVGHDKVLSMSQIEALETIKKKLQSRFVKMTFASTCIFVADAAH